MPMKKTVTFQRCIAQIRDLSRDPSMVWMKPITVFTSLRTEVL